MLDYCYCTSGASIVRSPSVTLTTLKIVSTFENACNHNCLHLRVGSCMHIKLHICIQEYIYAYYIMHVSMLLLPWIIGYPDISPWTFPPDFSPRMNSSI